VKAVLSLTRHASMTLGDLKRPLPTRILYTNQVFDQIAKSNQLQKFSSSYNGDFALILYAF